MVWISSFQWPAICSGQGEKMVYLTLMSIKHYVTYLSSITFSPKRIIWLTLTPWSLSHLSQLLFSMWCCEFIIHYPDLPWCWHCKLHKNRNWAYLSSKLYLSPKRVPRTYGLLTKYLLNSEYMNELYLIPIINICLLGIGQSCKCFYGINLCNSHNFRKWL